MRALSSLVVGFILGVGNCASQATMPPPAETFGALERVTSVELSPGGTELAWIQSDDKAQRVILYDVRAQKAKRVIDVGSGAKPRDIRWVDDETILIVASATIHHVLGQGVPHEYYRMIAADASGGAVRVLMHNIAAFEYITGATLLNARPVKPKSVYLWALYYSGAADLGGGRREDSGWIRTLFEVDTITGNARIFSEGTPFTTGWVVDRTGQVLARSEWNPRYGHYRLLAAKHGGWREVLSQDDEDQMHLVGPTSDGIAVFARGRHGQVNAKVWRIPLDGSTPSVFLEEPDQDVIAVHYDPEQQSVTGVRLGDRRGTLRCVDAKMQERYLAVQRAFKNKTIGYYDESKDHQRAVALVGDASTPPIYYLVDFETHKSDIIGETYPELGAGTLGAVSEITYPARDGTSIPALLILPPESKGKTLPLVVLPHGGPESRDADWFDWLAQFVATRGYAVLQPQFRGSTGNGDAFRRAGEHQWGQLIQDDITDGVKALIERGVADPSHVCILGQGFGGYAALAGAAFTSDLYACAVSIGGMSDLPGFLAYVAQYSGAQSDRAAAFRRLIGSAGDASVVARSPAHSVATIKVPVLLIHGEEDTVVPPSQSESMARALTTAGKKVVLLKLPREDHWLSYAESRTRVLKEVDTFLGAYLK